MSALAIDILVANDTNPGVVLVQSKQQPVTCKEVELALLDGDREKARETLQLYKQNITCRNARREQLSCLRMRLEYRKAEVARKLLMELLRSS